MSAKLLIEVALRVLGLWFLCSAIITLTTTTTFYLANVWIGQPTVVAYLVSSGFAIAIQLAMGVMLIRWAAGIAVRFYPPDADNAEPQIRVGPGDIYHTACFVLGAYLLVLGVDAAGRLGVEAVFGLQWSGRLASDAISAIVYSASGLLLIFGSGPIGQFVSNLKYDPDSIPHQQFSLKLLLIVTGVVAVILGLIRVISVGGL